MAAQSTLNRDRAKRPPQSSSREAPFQLVRDTAADGTFGDGLTLDGWGAVFNRQTIIDSWEGRFKEQIANGSMKRSFRESPPKIQFDHGRHPLIGSLPVASLTKVEEAHDDTYAPDGGAHIVGRLLDNWLVQPVRDAVAAGVVDGMSFRFEVLQEDWVRADGSKITSEQDLWRELDRVFLEDLSDDELPVRTLRQLKVPEMGPVTWPAYEETSVGVRSKLPKVIDLSRLNEPSQQKLLARAVFVADAVAAGKQDAGSKLLGARATDTPITIDDDDKVAALAQSLDATLDQASELVGTIDLPTIDPVAAQVCNLVTAAETVADELLEAMGLYDPDDDESDEDSGRSGQPVTEKAERHPDGEQRTTITAGEHSNGQHATAKAGGHQSPSVLTDKQLRLRNQRDRLLTLRAIGDRP